MGGRGASSASGRRRSGGGVKNRGVTIGTPGTGMQVTSEGRLNGKIYFVNNYGEYRDYDQPSRVLNHAAVQRMVQSGNARFLKQNEMTSLNNARDGWQANKPGYELYGYDQSDIRGRSKLVYRPRQSR